MKSIKLYFGILMTHVSNGCVLIKKNKKIKINNDRS